MIIEMDDQKDNQKVVVMISGEIDVYTAPKLKETLFQIVENGAEEITVDLSDVTYMDSTGLGVFVGTFKMVCSRKGKFELVGLSKRMRRLFDITGLSDIIQITSDLKGEV